AICCPKVTAIDHESRPLLCFCVTFHFRRELPHLRRVRKAPVLVGDHPDRQRHEWHAMQLSPSILPEVVARAPILLVVLIRHERVEHFQHLGADGRNTLDRYDYNKIVTADVTYEPGFS